MAEKLTPQQACAVNDRGGRLLVSAAAGSGKTKVLVDRVLSYLTDPVDPGNLDEFLIITYTKAAAAELRGKIAAKLTERIAQEPGNRHLQQQMQRLHLTKISTVHAFCADVLREYAYRLDLSADFRVADENECRALRETVVQQLLDDAYGSALEDGDFRAFIDTQGLGRNDSLVPALIQKVYDSARCHLDPEQWLRACVENFNMDDVTDAAQTVWGRQLMEGLFHFLDSQIEAMDHCAQMLGEAEGLEKQAALFADIVYQLKQLRQAQTWDQIMERSNIDFGRLVFPKNLSDSELAEQVKAVRKLCQSDLKDQLAAFSDPSRQVLRDLADSGASVRGLVWLVREFTKRYDQVKRGRRILDFGDLEHRMLDLLLGKRRSGVTAAASELGKRFREIMVDEYQDSNEVQDAIFDTLSQERQNLFMVGDVKQSIYQFRLADPGIFLKKYASYLPAGQAKPRQGRKVLLSSNFRSAGPVIAAVNDVFGACMSEAVGGLDYGVDEALYEGIPHVAVAEPEVEFHMVEIGESTYREEPAYVARQVESLLDGSHMVRQGDRLRPIQPEDIVILLRSPGSVGAHYQSALEERGIRCTSGGGENLLQTPEIHVLRALLQTISNPRQDIPLLAALMSPLFGFTADDMAALRAEQKRGTIYEALMADDSAKSRQFVEQLGTLRQEARMSSLTKLLETIFTETKIEAVYAAMPGGNTRCAHLRSFYQLAADFEAVSRRDLSQFLEHLEALDEKGLLMGAEQSTGAVTIMSIHKSKGLEFPVVILAGLSRRFNQESLREQVLCDKDLGLGLNCIDVKNRVRYPSMAKRAIKAKMKAQMISEELRVLYVAMTRAKDRLIMTYATDKCVAKIQEMVTRMDICCRELITGDVSCPGEWVLFAALQRMEAGELHQLGGRPKALQVSDVPWKICVGNAAAVAAVQEEDEVPQESGLSEETWEKLRQALAFQYGHMEATRAPSKQTATGRKGRAKDQEAAENAKPQKTAYREWRKPSFQGGKLQGKTVGNAIHAVMQDIHYEACTDVEGVRREIRRLVQAGRITQEQADVVRSEKIAAFFSTQLGKKLRQGENVLREFKFSVLDEGSAYGDGLDEEQVLLQGVVDCALIEADGITVVDFKTDRVSDEGLAGLVQHYRPQVKAYSDALEKIYETRVKGAYLYFFHLDRLIEV